LPKDDQISIVIDSAKYGQIQATTNSV